MLPRRFSAKVLEIVQLGLKGHPGPALRAVTDRLHRESRALGLRRDLTVPFTAPQAKIPIEVRPLTSRDNLAFLAESAGGQEEYFVRLGQRSLLKTNLSTCYIALANGDVAYMQWLISADQQRNLETQFGDLFPALSANEALMEGAYTVPAYRGLGIMASAMAQIAAQATRFGARWVITFVDERNVPSLKGCERAGFSPYIVRRESWRLLQRSVEFQPWLLDTATHPRAS